MCGYAATALTAYAHLNVNRPMNEYVYSDEARLEKRRGVRESAAYAKARAADRMEVA